MKIVVTGSSGLIGSEVVRYFDARRCEPDATQNLGWQQTRCIVTRRTVWR